MWKGIVFIMNLAINSVFLPCQNNNYKKNFNSSFYSPLSPLNKDTVSFGIKKTQLHGTDIAIKEKFKPPIEKFKSNDAFQAWCNQKLEHDYLNKIFIARQDDTTTDRQDILLDWFDYCLNPDNKLPASTKLLIIDGITSDLHDDNDNLPPLFNQNVLNKTLYQIQDKITKNIPVSFNNLYQNNLIQNSIQSLTGENNPDFTGWLVIDGGQYLDSDSFYENVYHLKVLSLPSWCTKSFKAEEYLDKGDFHIYFEHSKPKIGARYNNCGDLEEIQGEKNDSKIPLQYLDLIKERFHDYDLMSDKAVQEFQNAEQKRTHMIQFQQQFSKPIDTASFDEILSFEGMFDRRDDDGSLILSSYSQPDENLSWDDLGFDENLLFKNIKAIEGNANFRKSKLYSLHNLQEITGNAIFGPSKLQNLGNLREIGGNASFKFSHISNLDNLEKIGGKVLIRNSNISPNMLNERGFEELIQQRKIHHHH